ncbi:hypothetical protein Tco_0299848 [Tanacetum coccineum]
MTNGREMTPPPGFSTPTHILNVNTNERPPVTTIMFAATIPGNTSFAYRASTSTDPTPMISPLSEDYDEEREMEPRPERTREVTPPLRTRSPRVRRQCERVAGFKEAPNREGNRIRRNTEDDTLQILGLHEDQRISGFVHGLRTRNLLEYLSTNLPSTYKGLMEKTYTWIEVREVATNGAPNDRRDNFERSRKSSWDNSKGKKSRDRFLRYWGPNRRLLSNLSKSPREILATEKIEEAVKSGQLFHLVKRIKKEREKAFDSQRGEKKEKNTTPAEAPILMINWEEACTRNNISKSPTFEGKEITFPLVTKGSNSLAPIIIKAKILVREVGRVHMDSGSSCEVIYEHCFLKLKPSIQLSMVDSQVPLVGFSREKSWALEKFFWRSR